jgi:hypothetical protein
LLVGATVGRRVGAAVGLCGRWLAGVALGWLLAGSEDADGASVACTSEAGAGMASDPGSIPGPHPASKHTRQQKTIRLTTPLAADLQSAALSAELRFQRAGKRNPALLLPENTSHERDIRVIEGTNAYVIIPLVH